MIAVLHIDALSIPFADKLAAEGRMPVLSELRRRGTWHLLETPAAHFPASSYFSLHSGYEPGDHGHFFSFQWSAQEQRLHHRLYFEAPTTVWEQLTDAGRRSLVVDPYELSPPRRLAGAALSGWQYRNIISLERWSVPSGWERPYARRLGRGPYLQEVFGRRGLRSLDAWRRVMVDSSSRMTGLGTELLGGKDLDAAYLCLLGPHHAGHVFWDVSELELDEQAWLRFEGALADVYEAADRALGVLVDALPEGADLVVVSPLGMGPNTSLVDFAGPMLQRVLTGGDGRTEKASGSRIWRLRAAVPTSVRGGVARALGAGLVREITARLSTSGADWSSTRAFLLPSDENGQIRLNLRGRERDGIVDPAEADGLLTEIAEGLLSFRHEDGAPAIAAVERSQDLYPGCRADLLPDLVVRWSPVLQSRVRSVHSDRYGEVVRPLGSGTGRNGRHTPDAFALVVPGDSRPRILGRPARVTDVAATILASQGVDPLPGAEPLLD